MTDGRTDGQTDGQTDGFAIAYSALSMLSRAKNKGDKFILGDPLPLRSTETENFKRRYLRYLRDSAKWVEIDHSDVSVGTFKWS